VEVIAGVDLRCEVERVTWGAQTVQVRARQESRAPHQRRVGSTPRGCTQPDRTRDVAADDMHASCIEVEPHMQQARMRRGGWRMMALLQLQGGFEPPTRRTTPLPPHGERKPPTRTTSSLRPPGGCEPATRTTMPLRPCGGRKPPTRTTSSLRPPGEREPATRTTMPLRPCG
jgi:hypothetical protein